jgi:hypothetical protein
MVPLCVDDLSMNVTDDQLERAAQAAVDAEVNGQPLLPHVFWQGREWYGFKPEQCVCGHMLEHPIHDVDLRPFGISF